MAYEKLRQLDVEYDNKAYGNLIDPYEWNQNFKKIEEVVNQNTATTEQNFDAVSSSNVPSPAIEDLGQTIDSNVLDQLILIVNSLATKSDNIETSNKINQCVKEVSFDSNTGVFTFTDYDGSTSTIDTALEKVPAKMELVDVDNDVLLRITNQDGTYTETNVTSLLNLYTFNNTATIRYTANGYTVSSEVVSGSIEKRHLSETVLKELDESVASANASAISAKSSSDNADAKSASATASANAANNSALNAETNAGLSANSAKLSESYAKGGTGTRTGEDTDNAKYYSGLAKTSADISERAKVSAETAESNATASARSASASKTAVEVLKSAVDKAKASAEMSATSATASKTSAETAATTATQKATEAVTAAETAVEKAGVATTAMETATTEANRSKSEADRAKTEADRASEIVGGDFATKTEAQGYIRVHNTAEDAHTAKFSALSTRVDQCFQSVSNGKTKVAAAITDKGVQTASDATFDVMVRHIQGIEAVIFGPLDEMWSFTGHTREVYSVAVDSSGNVYFGGYYGDNTVRKINPNGEQVWSFLIGNNIMDIAVDSTGNIYSAGQSGPVCKINSNGEQVWSYTIPNPYSVFSLVPDNLGNVYIYYWFTHGYLQKLDCNGKMIRNMSFNGPMYDLKTDLSGNLYAPNFDGGVFKLGPDNKTIWLVVIDRNIMQYIAVDGNENVYTGGNDGVIHKINADGTRGWSFAGYGQQILGIVTDNIGDIYVGDQSGAVYKINSNGEQVWYFADMYMKSIAVDKDHNIILGCSDSVVRKFTQSPEGLFYQNPHGEELSQPWEVYKITDTGDTPGNTYTIRVRQMDTDVSMDYGISTVQGKNRKGTTALPNGSRDMFELIQSELIHNDGTYLIVKLATLSDKARIRFNYPEAPTQTFIGITADEINPDGIRIPTDGKAGYITIPYTVTSEDGIVTSQNEISIEIFSINTNVEFVEIQGVTSTSRAAGPYQELDRHGRLLREYYVGYVTSDDLEHTQAGGKTYITVQAEEHSAKTVATLYAENGEPVCNSNIHLSYQVTAGYDTTYAETDSPYNLMFQVQSEACEIKDYELDLYRQ